MKIKELSKFLGCAVDEITETEYGTYEHDRCEYLVLTDAEADIECKKRILEDLWAFRAKYIVRYTRGYWKLSQKQSEVFATAIEKMQEELCESCNPIMAALICDIDGFVTDAVDADGRGHFLASYDGEEVEAGEFFIYRIN